MKDVGERTAVTEGHEAGDGLHRAMEGLIDTGPVSLPSRVAEGLREREVLAERPPGEMDRGFWFCFGGFK